LGDTQRLGATVENAAACRNVLEGSVAAVAKKPTRVPAIGLRGAVGFVFAVQTAEDIGVGRPLNIVADKQVQQSIPIVVEPDGGSAEAFAIAKTACFGDIYKGPLPRVLEEAILADTGNQDVRETIVVVVSDRHSHAVHLHIKSAPASYVREGAVTVVVEQAHGAANALVAWPIGSVYQQDVLPAVIVVVKEGAPGAHGFRKILATKGAAVVMELNARGGRDICEVESLGSGWSSESVQQAQCGS